MKKTQYIRYFLIFALMLSFSSAATAGTVATWSYTPHNQINGDPSICTFTCNGSGGVGCPYLWTTNTMEPLKCTKSPFDGGAGGCHNQGNSTCLSTSDPVDSGLPSSVSPILQLNNPPHFGGYIAVDAIVRPDGKSVAHEDMEKMLFGMAVDQLIQKVTPPDEDPTGDCTKDGTCKN